MGFEISLSVSEFDNTNHENLLFKATLNKMLALFCFMSVLMKIKQELPNF